MVKIRKQDIRKEGTSKRYNATGGRAKNINASTEVEICGEQLSPFGRLLGLVKF